MASTSVFTLLSQAGWTMLPLYGCSLAALMVVIRKTVQFRQGRIGDTDLLSAINGDRETLLTSCEAHGSPLGRVLAVAARDSEDPERAEGAAQRAAVAELDHYEAWLHLLGFLAQAAPLFGLLGTVIGMVDLFASMEAAGSEVSTTTLSSGIWKALLTTAAGLMVAIPALGAHLWFTRRLQLLQHHMEDGVGRILARAR